MPDKKLKELLRKYLNGTATPEERRLVDNWYDSLSGEQEGRKLSDRERLHLRDQYWSRLKAGMSQRANDRITYSRNWMALAAAVTALLAVAYFYLPSFRGADSGISYSDMAEVSLVEKTFENLADTVRHIMLPDNSRVVLFPGTVLEVYRGFNLNERKVSLTGRAFFDISRNESKPFSVLSNEIVTKVLGTSFTISAYPAAAEITVEVTSGVVSVYADKEEHQSDHVPDVILNPNQQAIYNKSQKTVSRTLVEAPKVLIPEEEVKQIRFEGVPVSEIFRALEKMYGVDIQFDEMLFSKCSMTTSISKGDLFEKIDVICEITGSQYTLYDTSIRITGAGCD